MFLYSTTSVQIEACFHLLDFYPLSFVASSLSGPTFDYLILLKNVFCVASCLPSVLLMV